MRKLSMNFHFLLAQSHLLDKFFLFNIEGYTWRVMREFFYIQFFDHTRVDWGQVINLE